MQENYFWKYKIKGSSEMQNSEWNLTFKDVQIK